jgi:hypothetical protein
VFAGLLSQAKSAEKYEQHASNETARECRSRWLRLPTTKYERAADHRRFSFSSLSNRRGEVVDGDTARRVSPGNDRRPNPAPG